jgi:hypothetical protein
VVVFHLPWHATDTPAETLGRAMRKVYHVVNDKGRWKVRSERATRATLVATSREEAVDRAKALAERAEFGKVIIHREDGSVERELTCVPVWPRRADPALH